MPRSNLYGERMGKPYISRRYKQRYRVSERRNSSWVGSNDVTIENNYVHDVAGDGIVPINTTDALVQYNLIDNSADSSWDYSANPNHAALWTWDTTM